MDRAKVPPGASESSSLRPSHPIRGTPDADFAVLRIRTASGGEGVTSSASGIRGFVLSAICGFLTGGVSAVLDSVDCYHAVVLSFSAEPRVKFKKIVQSRWHVLQQSPVGAVRILRVPRCGTMDNHTGGGNRA